ncbi:cupin domain-containing protein [Spirosoma aerolatum]|uniref:hypothetical protein n=1 Tax=Spirosoma aerolatum TaxID=1211326 RepID=UPI0015D013A0|nr:hypothetical protein [Spirosoma aerolatum]
MPTGHKLAVVKAGTIFQQQFQIRDNQFFTVPREGDSVTIPPQVTHWHGAGPSGQFTHIAINPNVSKGGAVNWLQTVTDEEYNKAP